MMGIGQIRRIVLISTLLSIAAANAAYAASFTYSVQPKKIKAGVLIGAANRIMDPRNRPDPYAFYVMDARQDLKPAGWQIYNPLASSHVTQDVLDRWMVGTVPATVRGQGMAAGDRITKDMGCYWEVPLSAPLEDLEQYDVLLLTSYRLLNFSRWEREKLRKFVDSGGVLWIEYRKHPTTGTETQVGPNFFIPGLGFGPSSTVGNPPPAAMTAKSAFSHSLVNRPFLLLWKDISALGRGRVDTDGIYYPDYWKTSVLLAKDSEASNCFFPIIVRGVNPANANPIVVAAQYGSGFVIVSAESIGQAISDPLGLSDMRKGDYRGLIQTANSEDLRFAYNILSWGSEHTTFHKGARRTGYSFAEIGSPLRPLWTYYPNRDNNGVPVAIPPDGTDRSPAILDDTIFYVDGQDILHAFDLSPVRDRDGDGNSDDGIQDYSLGAEYDELWFADLGGPSSAPTVAYVPRKDGRVVPTVFVETRAGEVMGFDASWAIPPDPQPVRAPVYYFTDVDQALRPFDRPGDVIPTPTYADGTLYVGDGRGILHAHRFYPNPPDEWSNPNPTTVKQEAPAYSPTVGYVHDPTSGATEQVVYLAQRVIPNQSEGIVRAYPIKVFNEVLTKLQDLPLTYRIRSMSTPILNAGWTVYRDPGTGPVPILPPNVSIPPGSTGRFEFTGVGIQPGDTILADYQLDYNTPNPQVYRSIGIQWTGVQGQQAGITGSPAAGKNDIIYFGTDNGSLYAVKESGIPQTNEPPLMYKWRWCLQDDAAAGFLRGSPAPFGSPAVANDMVYFAANAGNQQGYILAFKADPEFVVKLGQPINRGNALLVRQQDTIIPEKTNGYYQYTGTVSTDPNKIPANAVFLADYDTGELRFVNFKLLPSGGQLTVSQRMTVVYTPAPKNPNDVVQQTSIDIEPFDYPHWSPNTPYTVGRVVYPNQPNGFKYVCTTPGTSGGAEPNPWPTQLDTPVPDGSVIWKATAMTSDWNNLVWFMRIPAAITSSPMVMGDILYVGLSDGSLGAIDLAHSSIPKEGPGEVQWMPGGNAWAGLPLPASSLTPLEAIEATVTGSHGMLGVVTPKGLGVLYSPVTLVTEPDQIAEIDAGSRKTWICDATTSYTGTSTATDTDPGSPVFGATKTPFNKPSVARRASIGGTIVADTGNNRVVHIDRAGTVLWEITDFDPRDPVTGAPLLPPGSSESLNKPTDVTMWACTELDDPTNSGGTSHPAYHYLIADSGNYRVVEIVAKLDQNINAYRNVLRWSTRTLAQGKQYRFTTARPLYIPDPEAGNSCSSPFVFLNCRYDGNATYHTLGSIVCAISKYDTNDGALDVSGGGLLKIDRTIDQGQFVDKMKLITELPIEGFQDPGTYSQPNPDPLLACSGTVNNASHNPANPGAFLPPVHLYDPVFFNRQYISKTEFHDLVIDAVGVHVVSYTPSPTSGKIELTTRTYKITDHPRPFVPSYAQYLPNGNVLVTSRATSPSGQAGELFEIEPVPLALDSTRTGMRLVPNSSIFNVRQPLSAERQIF